MAKNRNEISIGLTNDFQVATGEILNRGAFRAAASAMGITPRVIGPDGQEEQDIVADDRNLDVHIDDKGVITDIVVGWIPRP